MRRCSVCASPRLHEVDAAIVAGRRQAPLARMIGVSRYVMNRHVKLGHVMRSGMTPDLPSVAMVDTSMASAEEQIRAIVATLDAEDPALMNPAVRMNWYREKRLAAEALAKVTPPRMTAAERLDEVEGWAAVEAVLVEALEPFPEARMALLEALEGIA